MKKEDCINSDDDEIIPKFIKGKDQEEDIFDNDLFQDLNIKPITRKKVFDGKYLKNKKDKDKMDYDIKLLKSPKV